MVTALSLGLNGNAITLSCELWARMKAADPMLADARPATAQALRRVLEADRSEGLAPLTFAVVHPMSSHNYQLRYWLASADIDPDRDVRLIVVPPARMLANLKARRIAGYCVGAPWSQSAVADGIGHIPITGYELWHNAPEKVLGVSGAWAESYPITHRALIRALIRACHWLDEPGNRARITALVASPTCVDCDAEPLPASYAGQLTRHVGAATEHQPDHLVFARHQANFPWRSHALWFMGQMQRWGQLHGATDIHAAAWDVYRPDIYREVAQSLGLSAPLIDLKTEGEHATIWQCPGSELLLGPDLFFDGGRFDPADTQPVLHGRAETMPLQGDN
jgi:ABC-type nitrate/sulfonate/bicarbonate transport system substrate-binding protein